MMRDRKERATGVVLKVMSVDGIAEQALAAYNAKQASVSGEQATEMRVGWQPYGVLVRGDRVWVVNNEGVGSEVTDERPLEIDLYPEWGESRFSMVPAMSATLNPAEVLKRCGDETVDLSEHVRVFGARLEENFWTWHRIATEQETARG